MPPKPSADFESLLRVLHGRGIRCVVVGGVSAALQGVPAVTYDLDVVLDPEPANLDSAFELLGDLDAHLREHLPARILPIERGDLDSAGTKLLMTSLGPLDILGELSTGWRFADLSERTVRLAVGDGLHVEVLDLPSLIEVKEKVGREKDLALLPLYRRVLRETREPGVGD